MPVKNVKDIKVVFSDSNWGPGGDSQSHNLKINKLCQLFTSQILSQNWPVRFAQRVDPSRQFPELAGKEHFSPEALNNTEGAEVLLHRLGTNTEREQGSAKKRI